MLNVRAEQPGGMFVDWESFSKLVRGKTTLMTLQKVFRVHFHNPQAVRLNRIIGEYKTALEA